MTPSKRPVTKQPTVDRRPIKGGREETGKPTLSQAKKKRKKRRKKTKRRSYTPEKKLATTKQSEVERHEIKWPVLMRPLTF